MTSIDARDPSPDELLAMAYVDGELAAKEIETFERRMATEPALAREVAELQRLHVMARQYAPAEPKDHEWLRLEQEFVHSTGWTLGWIFAALGAMGLGLSCAAGVWLSEMHPMVKFFLAVSALGFATLFLLILRARLRTLPLDPYTEVKR